MQDREQTPLYLQQPNKTYALKKYNLLNLSLMKKIVAILVPVLILFAAFKKDLRDTGFIKDNFLFADKQLKGMLVKTGEKISRYPKTTDGSGRLVTTNLYDWTTGFFPGNLWYAYEYSKDPLLEKSGTRWTTSLEPLKSFTQHHDLGFMMYCSYGNAYRITGKQEYKDILVQSARSLSTRFNKTTGTIKSWNVFHSWHGNKSYYFPVIIDNMMNLELLFFASKVTGDPSFKNIAVTHALNTMKNQIRKDYSSFHVICYDSASGKVEGRETAQGYADNSTWSRGHAWGIYGFTMCYRETKDERFLKTAQGMANWYLDNKNLPADKIPYWDFNIGEPGYTPGVKSNTFKVKEKLRDASAAAITASALLELSTYPGKDRKKYYEAAVQMLHSLASPAYRAQPGTNGNFLLMHSVGSIPHGAEIDKPLVYADYYFLEALHRYDQLLAGKPLKH
jgi:unsaturated chondroitin disaccharide hydrolase